MYKFSKSTGGFYIEEIHGDNIPDDCVDVTEDQHLALMQAQAAGKIIQADKNGKPIAAEPPPLTTEQIIVKYVSGIQSHLDSFAKTRNYDNCLSCCTYATSAIEKFATEGQRMIELRDSTWNAAYELLNQYQSGEIEQPSFDDVLNVLPELTW